MTTRELATWRERMGWTQERLAHALGVHPMTVSKWERGATTPPAFLRLALTQLEEGGR